MHQRPHASCDSHSRCLVPCVFALANTTPSSLQILGLYTAPKLISVRCILRQLPPLGVSSHIIDVQNALFIAGCFVYHSAFLCCLVVGVRRAMHVEICDSST